MSVQLAARIRNHETKSEAKSIRREGGVPAVVYGKTIQSQPIAVDSIDFIKVIREVGRNGIIDLELGNGDKHAVMVHDLQTDPLKNEVIHVDFYQVNLKEKLDSEVPIHLTGEAVGQREDGVVQQTAHTLNVRALPSEFPNQIDVNIEDLQIGDSILVSDIKSNGTYEILNEDEEVVVSIVPPTKEESEGEEEPGDAPDGEENAEEE